MIKGGEDSDGKSKSTLQLSDNGQSARIAFRKIRIEQTRASKLKSDNADGKMNNNNIRSIG